eukprot:TRINITY_DN11706_c0_g1_i1.p1 TRINITY_DN11706_c0_g1~~TRINITY_DN11706_c0_g1_i1.p1  ORF type:complete len:362 (+),score=58.58 TRINITY_DN11706_c0_g1_i1:56-1141(+)
MATLLRDLLSTFLYEMERHRFAHAAEVLKAESNYGIMIHYADLIHPLLLFSVCERLYYSKVYLEPVWVQNESLNQMYLQVANDLRKAIIRFQKLNIALSEASPTTPSNIISSPPRSPMKKKEQASSESTPHDSLSKESLHFSRPSSQRLDIHAHLIEPYQSGDSPSANFHMRYAAIQSARTAVQSSSCVDVSFFVQLLEQLCDFIQLRRELLSFYSVMANINSFPYDFKVLADAVSAIRERYLNSFRHPLLAVFQTHALCEQTILVDLFKTQDALSRFDYMESIYWNFMTKQELIGWKNTIISLASSPSFVSALAAIGATAMDKSEEKTLLSNHILNWFDFFNHALFSKLVSLLDSSFLLF